MPRLFLTKVWGFDPELYPALGFNSDGARRNFLRAPRSPIDPVPDFVRGYRVYNRFTNLYLEVAVSSRQAKSCLAGE
jgi:hypothetical protein